MINVIYDHSIFEGTRASKSEHDVYVYDENNKVIHHISNIFGDEWEYIAIEGGEWSEIESIPSYEDTIQANLDFITMMNESLETENEVLRADVDYLLMMIGE